MRQWRTRGDDSVCRPCSEMDGMYGKTLAVPKHNCESPLGCRCVAVETCPDCGHQYDARIPHECKPVARPPLGQSVPVIPVVLEAQWIDADGRYLLTLPSVPHAGDTVVWHESHRDGALVVRRVAHKRDGLVLDMDMVGHRLTPDQRAHLEALGWELSDPEVEP